MIQARVGGRVAEVTDSEGSPWPVPALVPWGVAVSLRAATVSHICSTDRSSGSLGVAFPQ